MDEFEGFAESGVEVRADSDWGLDDTPDEAVRQEPEMFRLKYLGEEFGATREEVVTLAQKGRDYDRIRERADDLGAQLRETEAEVETLAKMGGAAFRETLGRLREESEGKSARRARGREVTEFLAAYPAFDPETMPGEVWEAVRNGTPLLGAYRAHENEALRHKVAELEQREANRGLSMGSRATAGGETQDMIEADWYIDTNYN